MAFLKAIRDRFDSLVLDAKRITSLLCLFAAVVLAIASGVGSFFVPTKLLGVLLAALGCFVAGWMFATSLSKFDRFGAKNRETAEALRAELKKKADEVGRLENVVADLKADRDRLEKQRIDINAVRPILKLGLVEADMSVKDVKIAWMNDFDSEGLIESLYRATRSQYVGVLERSFKASYGVDLMKLRIREEDNRIRVAGIEPESLGFKDDETKWLVRQKQTYRLTTTDETGGGPMPVADPATGFKNGEKFYEIDRTEPFEGSLDLNTTATFCTEQERELRKRLNNGIGEDFRNVNLYIRRMAEGFIQTLLSPVGKPVEFDSIPLAQIEGETDWLSLEEFAKDWNKSLEVPMS